DGFALGAQGAGESRGGVLEEGFQAGDLLVGPGSLLEEEAKHADENPLGFERDREAGLDRSRHALEPGIALGEVSALDRDRAFVPDQVVHDAGLARGGALAARARPRSPRGGAEEDGRDAI